MRRALLLALCLVLAGCQAPSLPFADGQSTEGPPGAGPAQMGPAPDDPETDRLGWENGYWHNESIDVTPGDGLNESEREAVVSRAMARLEYVRELEFEETVPVDVINRSTYREENQGNHSDALVAFDNAKFEALFLIGEEEGSIETQEETRGQTVLGYYSSNRDAIVLVSERERPTISSERVLAHELVHALQDQHFDLGNLTAKTRDTYQGRNGIVEGDASYTERLYTERCGAEWVCIDGSGGSTSATEDGETEGGATADDPGTADGDGADGDGAEDGDGSSGGSVHAGIQVLDYFPYSDGPGFVASVREEGGWEAVNDVYADVPDGSPEVIDPATYPDWEPASVSLRDRASDDWTRIEPPNRPNYGVMGQSAIVASQAYTITDDVNSSAVVEVRDVVNVRSDGSIDREDPYDYETATADGWAGGRFYAYEGSDDELAYVWRTRWESNEEAREFAAGWDDVVQHWGGERTGGDEWVIAEGSDFADAFRITVDGDTVTIVNAPTRAQLDDVHGG